ncbi:Hypothetical predicted protein [Octopus vulgaris]|uniref:Uncharacterized protein n=1 Tax=Octopus vulgaris TaxID=6645 RepID=A0AA36F4Y2_OCTVU|nr:Hypothetical predicted protein [Octopus vulgaris]
MLMLFNSNSIEIVSYSGRILLVQKTYSAKSWRLKNVAKRCEHNFIAIRTVDYDEADDECSFGFTTVLLQIWNMMRVVKR